MLVQVSGSGHYLNVRFQAKVRFRSQSCILNRSSGSCVGSGVEVGIESRIGS